MKINTCTNKHFLRKIKVFIRIRQFLDVYRQSHKKVTIFWKKTCFPIRCSLSVVVHNCLKKSTFLTKFNFLFSQNWQFCTKIDVEKNTRHFTPKFARHDLITVLKNSPIYPKTNTFCIKLYFLPKGNNTT